MANASMSGIAPAPAPTHSRHLFGRALAIAAGCLVLARSLEKRSARSIVGAFVGIDLILMGFHGRSHPAFRMDRPPAF